MLSKHLKRYPVHFCLLFCIGFLTACSQYKFEVNENVVYTPPTYINDEFLLDQKLRSCLTQEAKKNDIVLLRRISTLSCPKSKVQSLKGLRHLVSLSELYLGENLIADLKPLSQLKNLKVLDLSYNKVASIDGLKNLKSLNTLDLRGNQRVNCSDLETFVKKKMETTEGFTIKVPEHCLK